MKTIIITIIVALIIGFLLGLLLGVFKKLFAVKTDPKVEQIRNALSGANCGGCGYAGCDAFAEAVANGTALPTGCIAGGAGVAGAIAKILGVEAGSLDKKVTILACQGNCNVALHKGIYQGVQTCKAAQLTVNGTKVCPSGCIGLGDCVNVCPFDALSISKEGLPVVDYSKCTGCGKCVKECPKHLFSIESAALKGSKALCSNRTTEKAQIRKYCTSGCFKCGLCTKKCPEQCIVLDNGIPKVDYSKCTSCGECVKACPDHVLKLVQEIVK